MNNEYYEYCPYEGDWVRKTGEASELDSQVRRTTSDDSEAYPSDWKKVDLMASPKGTFHPVGGDRDGPPETDAPWPGYDRLTERIRRIEKERDYAREALELLDKLCQERLGSDWKRPTWVAVNLAD